MNTDIETIKARSAMYRAIRDFFDNREYLELETPSLSSTLIPEPTIECFETAFINPYRAQKSFYLIPSPELFMKPFIAATGRSVYQICKCFRNSEQLGFEHNPEFTMLEYYTVGYDEKDSIGLTKDLLSAVGIKQEIETMTMDQAFQDLAGFSFLECQKPSQIRRKAYEKGLGPFGPESWEDTFNRIFLTFVEPCLSKDHPVILTDYPRQIECLAKNDGLVKRRWEMYIGGIEVANCYDELTDVEQIRDVYERETAILSQRLDTPIPDTDPDFATKLQGMKPCSGVAMGLDRLLMAILDKKDIKDLILFPFSDMLT